jgi:hypothetical protein
MPYIKDTLSILAECASADVGMSKKTIVEEAGIRSAYDSLEETAEPVFISAEMVTVVKVGNDYMTEMNCLVPFMKSYGIKSVEEALNDVAIANGLPERSVGLLVESKESVARMIQEATKKSKAAKNSKAKNACLGKVQKATDLVNKLKSKGFSVKTKKEECGDNECGKVSECDKSK